MANKFVTMVPIAFIQIFSVECIISDRHHYICPREKPAFSQMGDVITHPIV